MGNITEDTLDFLARFIVDAKLTGLYEQAGWDAMVVDAEKLIKQIKENK